MLVAAVAVWGNVQGIDTQMHAQERQDRHSFIRAQRQAAYARMFQVDLALRTQEQDLIGSSCPNTPGQRGGTAGDRISTIRKQLDEVDVAAKNIAMIGSEAAWAAADTLSKAHHLLIDSWESRCNRMLLPVNPTAPAESPKREAVGINTAYLQLSQASKRFLALARAEVQS